MKTSIYEYRDYKKYINDLVDSSANRGRGQKKALAEAIHCQGAFVTHVLSGNNHFSLEQGEGAARFFGLSKDETEHLLLMINHNRAGTESLRKLFERLLQEKVQDQLLLKTRLKMEKSLSQEDRARYYSSWKYGTVHMLTTIPEFRTRETIARRLGLSISSVTDILEALMAMGILQKKQNEYLPQQSLLHLDRESPFIKQHHTAWRLRAIESLDHQQEQAVHYSVALSCSKKDLQKIQQRLTQCLEECAEIIKPSPEETLATLCVDFFEL